MFVERYLPDVILSPDTTSNEGMHNSEPFVQWIRYSESMWYPSRGQENARPKKGWRCALGWRTTAAPEAVTIQQFQGVIQHKAQLFHWARCNSIEYIHEEQGFSWSLLPDAIEADESLLSMQLHSLGDEERIQCFLDEEPRDQWDMDIFDVKLQWDHQGSFLQVNVDIPTSLVWKVYDFGRWSTFPVAAVESGVHNIRVMPPIGDIVFLHAEGAGTYKHVHQIQVVGRPGIASGRYVWHRGLLYHPRGCKAHPWVSAIIPVFHLSDIERFPRNSKIHQQQWWIEEATWTEEGIAMIKEAHPQADIVRMGSLDKPGAIVMLRPYEISADLPAQHLYAVHLFANSGEESFGENAAWLIAKLRHPKLQHLRFVERSWLAALGTFTNSDGVAQYGFGFSFTRTPEHEYRWSSAVRNIIFREDRESLPCPTCRQKASCKQLLPTSFLSAVGPQIKIPWHSLVESDCIVQKWFS